MAKSAPHTKEEVGTARSSDDDPLIVWESSDRFKPEARRAAWRGAMHTVRRGVHALLRRQHLRALSSAQAQHSPFLVSEHPTSSNLSNTDARDQVLRVLSGVFDPLLGRDVVSSGIASVDEAEGGGEGLDVVLTLATAAHPQRGQLAHMCAAHLARELPEALKRALTIDLRTATPARRVNPGQAPGLENVGACIAVSSCKGGVGKSTVAVHLAYALAARGARVGLLDADIHGPSLPTLVTPTDTRMRASPPHDAGEEHAHMVEPVSHRGVVLQSYGWVDEGAAPGAGSTGRAAVLRGPVVGRLVDQLATGTRWGSLDYLLIDMPPGTGDAQLSLVQNVGLDGAVVVTTPHRLSHVDVVKGVEMFHELDVPTLAVVENMSFFECDRGVRYRPFGDGHARELREQFHLDESQLFELPLSAATADANERALPLTLPAPVPDDEVDAATAAPAGTERAVYDALARRVIEDVYRRQHRVDRPGELPRATRVEHKHGRGIVMRVFEDDVAREYAISPVELRLRDPRTGRRLGDDAEAHARVPQDVKPKKITPKGSYGHAIEWSDGHKGVIYRNEALLWAARDAAGDV